MHVGSGTPIAALFGMRLLLAATTLTALTGCSGESMLDDNGGLQEVGDEATADGAALMLDVFPSDYSHPDLMPQSFPLTGDEESVALYVDTPVTVYGELTGFTPNQRSAVTSVPGRASHLSAEIVAEVPGTPMTANLRTEDGTFELEILPGQAYELAFMPDVDEDIPFLVEHAATFSGDTRLDTYIDYGVPIYGLVTDDAGQPMSEVEIRLVDPVSGLAGQPVTSDAGGAWSLRALEGSWDVVIDGGTTRPWLPTWTHELVVDAELEEERLDVVYGRGDPLRASGRVVDADGDPLEDVRVRLTSLELADTDGELVAETETDGNGSFSARVVAGTYQVELIPPYVGDAGPRLLEQAWQVDEHEDLGTLFLDERPLAQGVVRTPEGEPVVNAVVQATEIGFDGYIYEARTGADGAFELPAAEGELRWVVHPPEDLDLALTHFLLATDEVEELELVLGQPLSGCISSDGGALAYTPVDVRRGDEVLGTTTTDDEGCFAERIQP